jgi:cell division initiation protein
MSAQRIANLIKDEATHDAEQLLQNARQESETLLSNAKRISESMEFETKTKLVQKQMEFVQIKEQIKSLAEQKSTLQTQVDEAISYLEMAKGSISDILSSDDPLD